MALLPPNYTFGDLSASPDAQEAMNLLSGWYAAQKKGLEDARDIGLGRLGSAEKDSLLQRDRGIARNPSVFAARGLARSGLRDVAAGEIESANVRNLANIQREREGVQNTFTTGIDTLESNKGQRVHDINVSGAQDAYQKFVDAGGLNPPPPPPPGTTPLAGTPEGGIPLSQTSNIDPNAGKPDTHLETAPSQVGYVSARTPVSVARRLSRFS